MKEPTLLILVGLLCFGHCIRDAGAHLGGLYSDFDEDGDADLQDFAMLAGAWRTDCNAAEWNPALDISFPNDCVVDNLDLLVLCRHWLSTDMVAIGEGEFLMGDHFNEGDSHERPAHAVYVDSFSVTSCEVTTGQYCEFLNSASVKVVTGVVYSSSDINNSYPYFTTAGSCSCSHIAYAGGTFSIITKSGRDMSHDPVVLASWYGAAAYCNWRSQQEGKEICYDVNDPNWPCDFSKHGYRLPTEAEWEYAARGGQYNPYHRFPWGDTISHSQANYYSSSDYTYDVSPTRGFHPKYNDGVTPYTAPVASFERSGYGLYDMAGNAYEWCHDWYSNTYYSSSPYSNPTGPVSGTYRVLRGGSCYGLAYGCRVASRGTGNPASRYSNCGFRVVLDQQ